MDNNTRVQKVQKSDITKRLKFLNNNHNEVFDILKNIKNC